MALRFINRLKNTISAAKSLSEFNCLSRDSRKIVFYAEDCQSQNFLLDLIKEILVKFEHEVCYLTSDANDTIFNEAKKNSKLKVFYIGHGIVRTIAFLNLKADLCIMTMPDLDKFHLKRSKIFPVHYLYIFHALLSTHSIYRKGAFDSYDTIFCTGNHQLAEIRETEKVYELRKKNLFRDGYRPLEYLIQENKLYNKKETKHLKILIAPTWGNNNIFNYCIHDLLRNLVKLGHKVYLRPHPMTIRDSYNQIREVKDKFSSKENFFMQENHTDRDMLFESDILITDWSGIGIEYGLGLLKPVIYIDIPKKNLNPEYKKINLNPIESEIRDEIGTLVNLQDLNQIDKIIHQTLIMHNKEDLKDLRNKYVFMKRDGLNKSAKRIMTIANACSARNQKREI